MLLIGCRCVEVLLQGRAVILSRALAEAEDICCGAKSGDILSCDHQNFIATNVSPKPRPLTLTHDPHIGKNQSASLEIGKRAGSDNLKLQVLLHEQNEDSAIGSDEFVRVVVSRLGRKVNADRIDGCAWPVEGFLVGLDPGKDFLSCRQVVRPCHRVSWRIPEICAGHDLRGGQVHHRFARIHFLVAIPRVIQDPGGLALGEGTE